MPIETWGVPDVPSELAVAVGAYENVRSASLVDWLGDSMLVRTRFAETSQLHIVEHPLGVRRQISFFDETIAGAVVPPRAAPGGFLYRIDTGGSESYQICWFDLETF